MKPELPFKRQTFGSLWLSVFACSFKDVVKNCVTRTD